MSILKSIRHQLGLSATATHNYTLDASADDGTMKLAQGNAGATTKDVLNVDASGNITIDQNLTVLGTVTAAIANPIQPITATVASNALTVGVSQTALAFRNTTVGGAPATVNSNGALSLTVPSGATLGTVNGIAARLVLLALNNAGTMALGIVNLTGGGNLDETNLVSTIAISSGATANNVIYSASALTNVAYRVLGFIDITEATAGTWATAPTVVQGVGGQALAALGSLGYSQQWQNVSGSRAVNTTYYNTTGKPIIASVSLTSSGADTPKLIVNGSITIYGAPYSVGAIPLTVSAIIPPGGSYYSTCVTYTPSINVWNELR